MEVVIKLLGQEKVLASLARVSRVLSREGLVPQRIIGGEFLYTIHRAFQTQTSPEGEGWPAKHSDGGPALANSRLANSFFMVPTVRGVAIDTSMPEQMIHDTGGTIRAKSGSLLAIPARPEFRPMNGESIRAMFPKAFTIRSHTNEVGSDRVYLFERMGAGRQAALRLIATLVPFVKIPRRSFIPRFLPQSIFQRLARETGAAWGEPV